MSCETIWLVPQVHRLYPYTHQPLSPVLEPFVELVRQTRSDLVSWVSASHDGHLARLLVHRLGDLLAFFEAVLDHSMQKGVKNTGLGDSERYNSLALSTLLHILSRLDAVRAAFVIIDVDSLPFRG